MNDITPTEEIDSLPSRKFRAYDWSESSNVADFVGMLFTQYIEWARDVDGQQRIKNHVAIKTHLTCLTLELFRTYCIHPELSLAISLGNETISSYKSSRYKPHHISFRILNHVINFLESCRYLDFPLGGKARATGAPTHQRATRARATVKLISEMGAFGISQYMIRPMPTPPECIELRDVKQDRQRKANVLEYADTEFTMQARKNLNLVNSSFLQHHINLQITDEQETELVTRLSQREEEGKTKFLDLNDKQLKRIFNNRSFEEGGRFYGGFWQAIPKEYRFLITIDGDRTVQCDYSGMHFAMLYAKTEVPVPDIDFYQLDGFDTSLRSDIKQAFNIIINCKSVPEAIGSINSEIRKGKLNRELVDGDSLYAAFVEKHEPISDYIASGEGIKLQNLDSQIAEKVLLKGVSQNICILPIHDGFITSIKHENLLYEFMQEAYDEVIGKKINIKPESVYLGLIDDSQKGCSPLISSVDERGVKKLLEVDEYIGKVDSYSSILGVEDILTQMERYTRFQSREDDWYNAHGAI